MTSPGESQASVISGKDDSLARQMRRVEELVETLEKLGHPVARACAQELLATLLALHGTGLARLMELVGRADGGTLVASLGQDPLVGSLLLLHGLHPVAVETRVRRALEQVEPLIRGHGGEVELVAVVENVVRVRLHGRCSLSAEALQHLLEEAFLSEAPDVQIVEVEDDEHCSARKLALPVIP